jgi:hypothetical protein
VGHRNRTESTYSGHPRRPPSLFSQGIPCPDGLRSTKFREKLDTFKLNFSDLWFFQQEGSACSPASKAPYSFARALDRGAKKEAAEPERKCAQRTPRGRAITTRSASPGANDCISAATLARRLLTGPSTSRSDLKRPIRAIAWLLVVASPSTIGAIQAARRSAVRRCRASRAKGSGGATPSNTSLRPKDKPR